MVNQGKKQKYGTQFYLNKNGELIPRPIYDKKNLNKRRRKVGLENFTRYKKRLIERQDKISKNKWAFGNTHFYLFKKNVEKSFTHWKPCLE